MQSGQTAPQNIDEYIARFPPEVREILERIRLTIKKAAPEAQETIRYQMPTWRLNGNLVHFAAYKGHIGFYPTPSGMEKFKEELSPYPGGKGSVRFSLASPIPYALIRKIVQYRVQESKGRPAPKRMGKSRTIENRRSRQQRSRHPMPDFVRKALEENGLMKAYQERPAYQQNDYIGWMVQAKRQETREKRLHRMLAELAAGGVYMNMVHPPSRKG